MTIPSSGRLNASMINNEMGKPWGGYFKISENRTLAQVPSGKISFSNFYGKSNQIREPPSGVYYSTFWWNNNLTYWIIRTDYDLFQLYWLNQLIFEGPYNNLPWGTGYGGTEFMIFNYNGWKYYRGTLQETHPGDDYKTYIYYYSLYRQNF